MGVTGTFDSIVGEVSKFAGLSDGDALALSNFKSFETEEAVLMGIGICVTCATGVTKLASVSGTFGSGIGGATSCVPIAGGPGGDPFCKYFTPVAVIAPTPLEIRLDNPIRADTIW